MLPRENQKESKKVPDLEKLGPVLRNLILLHSKVSSLKFSCLGLEFEAEVGPFSTKLVCKTEEQPETTYLTHVISQNDFLSLDEAEKTKELHENIKKVVEILNDCPDFLSISIQLPDYHPNPHKRLSIVSTRFHSSPEWNQLVQLKSNKETTFIITNHLGLGNLESKEEGNSLVLLNLALLDSQEMKLESKTKEKARESSQNGLKTVTKLATKKKSRMHITEAEEESKERRQLWTHDSFRRISMRDLWNEAFTQERLKATSFLYFDPSLPSDSDSKVFFFSSCLPKKFGCFMPTNKKGNKEKQTDNSQHERRGSMGDGSGMEEEKNGKLLGSRLNEQENEMIDMEMLEKDMNEKELIDCFLMMSINEREKETEGNRDLKKRKREGKSRKEEKTKKPKK